MDGRLARPECGLKPQSLSSHSTSTQNLELRVEQISQCGVYRLLFVSCRHVAQGSLALVIFPGQFGDGLIGSTMRLLQEWRAQVGAAQFEARLGIACRCQRIVENALTICTGSIDDALRPGFCFE